MADYLEILESALALPIHERRELVLAVGRSLSESESAPPNPDDLASNSGLSAAWRAEIARRSEEIDKGQVQGVSWTVVRDQARRRHGQHG
jgi:putative addiction module component (TIGR02574 family)